MLTVDRRWVVGKGRGAGAQLEQAGASWRAPAQRERERQRELLLAWRPEQEGGESRNWVLTCNF